tara:strand:- start:184 stop:615 length:432 start_codon:yes stop_codon:yes gene_type:complete
MSPEGVRAYALMIEAGISLDRFGELCGVKVGTVRAALSSGRLSKVMMGVLHEMSNGLQVDRMVEEAKVEDEHEAESGERMGRVYAIPRNRYLRLVEFKDGSHGKFRTKDGKFGVGSVAKLVEGANGMWEVVGNYDRRSRLREG